MGMYKKEENIQVLEWIMLSVRNSARGNYEGRNYIEQLIERFSRLKKLSRQKKIITIA
jgi:hypothetical protein